MSLQTLTLELPTIVVNDLTRIARREKRSIADTIVAMVQAKEALPRLSDEVEAEMASYVHLSNESLRLLTHPPLTEQEVDEWDALRAGGGAENQRRIDQLLHKYDIGLLRRSTALSILQKRGVDITPFLQLPQV